MRALESVIQHMKTPVVYMNTSRLTDYRKDGHPSVYRKEYKKSMDQNSTALFEDCSHWCLPGVPDTWNELLYVSLLKYGRGTWKSWTNFLIIIPLPVSYSFCIVIVVFNICMLWVFLMHAFSDSLIRTNKMAREGNRIVDWLANSSHGSEVRDTFLWCSFSMKK